MISVANRTLRAIDRRLGRSLRRGTRLSFSGGFARNCATWRSPRGRIRRPAVQTSLTSPTKWERGVSGTFLGDLLGILPGGNPITLFVAMTANIEPDWSRPFIRELHIHVVHVVDLFSAAVATSRCTLNGAVVPSGRRATTRRPRTMGGHVASSVPPDATLAAGRPRPLTVATRRGHGKPRRGR